MAMMMMPAGEEDDDDDDDDDVDVDVDDDDDDDDDDGHPGPSWSVLESLGALLSPSWIVLVRKIPRYLHFPRMSRARAPF